MIEVASGKYIYTLEEVVPVKDNLLGGCYGCFFCKLRGSYFVKTCSKYPARLMSNCIGMGIIYKLIGKRLKDPDSLIGNKEAHY